MRRCCEISSGLWLGDIGVGLWLGDIGVGCDVAAARSAGKGKAARPPSAVMPLASASWELAALAVKQPARAPRGTAAGPTASCSHTKSGFYTCQPAGQSGMEQIHDSPACWL